MQKLTEKHPKLQTTSGKGLIQLVSIYYMYSNYNSIIATSQALWNDPIF